MEKSEASLKMHLSSIKQKLKHWEGNFSAKHGRKPNKVDIASSTDDIKAVYREYAYLKDKLADIISDCPSTSSMKAQSIAKEHEPNFKVPTECKDDVFGTKYNKSEHKNPLESSSHIKNNSLLNKHIPNYRRKRHLKLPLSEKNEPSDNHSLLQVNVLEVNSQDEATPEENAGLLDKNGISENLDITTRVTDAVTNSRKSTSRLQRRPCMSRWSKHLSKEWLEMVKPLNEPERLDMFVPINVEDCKVMETKTIYTSPTKVAEENSTLRGNAGRPVISDRVNSSQNLKRKIEGAIMGEDTKESGTNVERIFCETESLSPSCSVSPLPSEHSALNNNLIDCHVYPSTGKQIVSSAVYDSDDELGKGKNKQQQVNEENILEDIEHFENIHSINVSMSTSTIKRKREELDAPDNKEKVLDDCNVRTTKRLKKESSLKSTTGGCAGKRLVSENFVAIDIQKKKFCRGRRRIKASTYKRQQWKKKSQFSGKNSEICYKCNGTGHWSNECSKVLNHRRTVAFAETPKAEFSPLPQSNEFTESNTWSFEDLPHLPKCWPRIPHTLSSKSPVSPLFDAVDGKPSQEAVTEVNKALRVLGYNNFRAGQENAVARVVSGLSTLFVSSTGSGKSLCYQLPAFLYYMKAKYLTIVISPLVALMEDQIGNLPYGVKGACLHANMTKPQREKVLKNVSEKKIAILLLSPEALTSISTSAGYLTFLENLPSVAFVCVDEAHCISEWSHNFRPSYLRVCSVLRDYLGIRCFLGLTATSTKSTSLSISRHLGIADAESDEAILKGSFMPDNLHITISKDDDNKDQALVDLLASERFSTCTSIIIYCTRRDETERLSSVLRTCLKQLPPTQLDFDDKEVRQKSKGGKKGKCDTLLKVNFVHWDADFYHAGMTAAQRRRVQKQFMSGELRIVVATIAFGMGLDKADVRAIIHYNMPKSFESFLQEIGRAGRDGLPAYCHVFLDKEAKDLSELRRHIHADSVDFKTIKGLVNRIFIKCDCKERAACFHDKSPGMDKDDKQFFATHLHENHHNSKDGDDPFKFMGLHQSKVPMERDFNENLGNTAFAYETHNTQKDLQEAYLANEISKTVEYKQHVKRICSGHQVTFSVDEAVQAFDIREENIATLLSLAEQLTYVKITYLGTLQSSCTLQCYGGARQLKMLAMKFLPITAVFNHIKRNNLTLASSKAVTFNVVQISDEMGWDLSSIYKELRFLQRNSSFAVGISETPVCRSGILVEFGNQSFHVLAPGDLTDDERDQVCTDLYEMVRGIEKTKLLQLDALYNVLLQAAEPTVHTVDFSNTSETFEQLRKSIEAYFECEPSQMTSFLERLLPEKLESPVLQSKWDAISRDIRTMLGLHHDIAFNGRSLARIFHGIDSPCFPAMVWGRDRRFWRRYLDVDFDKLCQFATAEIIRYRT